MYHGQFLRSRVRFQADPVVNRMLELLFASEVSLRRLDRDVPQQGLNLIEFSAGQVT